LNRASARTTTPLALSCPMASKAVESSPGSCTVNRRASNPSRRAAVCASCQNDGVVGLLSLPSTAMRVIPGTACLNTSPRLPPSSVPKSVVPVMLPPGRARLVTMPARSGSSTGAITIGIVVVARFAGIAIDVATATMTSGPRSAWQIFLSQHPTGFYSDLARQQMAKLDSTAPAAPPGPATEEQRAWDKIKDSSNDGDFRDFIKKYPSSPLATTAAAHAAAIEAAARAAAQKSTDGPRSSNTPSVASRDLQPEQTQSPVIAPTTTSPARTGPPNTLLWWWPQWQ
jgi:hypothetical protein